MNKYTPGMVLTTTTTNTCLGEGWNARGRVSDSESRPNPCIPKYV